VGALIGKRWQDECYEVGKIRLWNRCAILFDGQTRFFPSTPNVLLEERDLENNLSHQ
jgi:hypothetical protein